MEWVVRETGIDESLFGKTAGIKARDDLDAILVENGVNPIIVSAPQEIRNNSNFIKKMMLHKEVEKCWKHDLQRLSKGDILYIQFPVVNHTIYLSNVIADLKKRDVTVFAFIHDLEYFRHANNKTRTFFRRWRLSKEETSVLKLFDGIVVHNETMKKIVNKELDIPMDRMVSLEIFDYLIPSLDESILQNRKNGYKTKSGIVAGNLRRSKALYLYSLPDNCRFELYGPNYQTDIIPDNVNYHGSFDPDDLPNALQGMFGLVWDGSSSETCEGVWGEYLKINNPHKTSLYLASGIPVAIWSQAAMAEFIKKNNVGIVVDSLYDLNVAFEKLTKDDYIEKANNAIKISELLRSGWYTKEAMKLLDQL